MEKQIIAVCGKGGVGKTVFSTLLSRVLIEAGIKPMLLIDADPAGGLTLSVGEHSNKTLAGLKDQLINSARQGEAAKVANQLDYLLLEALVERKDYSILAIGHSAKKGCFCPANDLLRNAIDALISSFSVVLIDAEAGIEHINRDVTRRVTRIVAVVDGSQKSIETLRLIMNMVHPTPVSVVANRLAAKDLGPLPDGANLMGTVPENQTLRQFDCEGRSLWELPPENEVMASVREIARQLGLFASNL